MNKLALSVTAIVMLAGLSSTAAFADQAGGYNNDVLSSFTLTNAGSGNFDFSFSGPSDSGSGVFMTSLTGTTGEFLITGITGTVDGSTINSLFPAGTFPTEFGGGDNLLFDPGVISPPNLEAAYLDLSGVSFAVANGTDYNLYYGQFVTGDPLDVYDLLSPAPSTPEPESLALLGTGMLALLGVATMRRRQEI